MLLRRKPHPPLLTKTGRDAGKRESRSEKRMTTIKGVQTATFLSPLFIIRKTDFFFPTNKKPTSYRAVTTIHIAWESVFEKRIKTFVFTFGGAFPDNAALLIVSSSIIGIP